MSDPSTLVNIGDLVEPATVLVKKIASAIGAIFEPWQIRRVAQAAAEADKIAAATQIEITDMQYRAMQRLFIEEGKRQENMEAITAAALPMLNDSSDPSRVDEDWIANFFDKARLVSDDEMRAIWAAVLAGEANTPGSFSRRTVGVLTSMDKREALRFATLCRFCVRYQGADLPLPLIYDVEDSVYRDQGLYFGSLQELACMGLITFSPLDGYKFRGQPQVVDFQVDDQHVKLKLGSGDENSLEVGIVSFSDAGYELASVVECEAAPAFIDYLIEKWQLKGYEIVQGPQGNARS